MLPCVQCSNSHQFERKSKEPRWLVMLDVGSHPFMARLSECDAKQQLSKCIAWAFINKMMKKLERGWGNILILSALWKESYRKYPDLQHHHHPHPGVHSCVTLTAIKMMPAYPTERNTLLVHTPNAVHNLKKRKIIPICERGILLYFMRKVPKDT